MHASLNCPSCGGLIKIASSASVFVTCTYCKSTLVHDRDWTLRGKVADLPHEMTHLQVGTTGTYENETFELIGRRRLRWDDGYWTEWCARFAGDRIGWLAEAQGLLAMGFEVKENIDLPNGSGLRAGTYVTVGDNATFTINDTKKAQVIGTEGEMPYIVDPGQSIVTMDATNELGGFCSFEWDARVKKWSTFVGRYMDFDDFKFQNLRQLDDW
ncbi:MAG: DUF4178 domain-containing protein [Bdellovibrionota bacterium]